MENGKKLIVLLLVLLLGSCFVGVASATVAVYVYNPISNGGYVSSYLDFTDVNDTIGMHFTGNGRYLYGVSICLQNDSAAETGVMQACLWNTSGAADADIPDAGQEPAAWSLNTFDLSGLVAGQNVTFYFASTYLLAVGADYCVGFRMTTVAGSGFEFGRSAGDGLFYSSAVNTYSKQSVGLCWYSWTTDTYGETYLNTGGNGVTPPTPDGDGVLPVTSDWDEMVGGFISWMIYLLVMVLPAWFLGMFLKMGKWGFVIGLAVGAGIGYAFISGFPLWLLILVSVGEAGLVYQSVSKG